MNEAKARASAWPRKIGSIRWLLAFLLLGSALSLPFFLSHARGFDWGFLPLSVAIVLVRLILVVFVVDLIVALIRAFLVASLEPAIRERARGIAAFDAAVFIVGSGLFLLLRRVFLA